MVKIAQIYRATNGSREPFSLEFKAEDFDISEIQGRVTASGHFMRVEEGIMMLLEGLDATQTAHCSRCGKALKLKLNFKPSEWLFYKEKPPEDDSENEWLELDTHRLELNPLEPVRQDILLNLGLAPRCKKLCKKFEESKPEKNKGVKALSGLKDLHL
ncbi:MAG: YceD family protein [Candidatus Gracilibacteria bacterium]